MVWEYVVLIFVFLCISMWHINSSWLNPLNVHVNFCLDVSHLISSVLWVDRVFHVFPCAAVLPPSLQVGLLKEAEDWAKRAADEGLWPGALESLELWLRLWTGFVLVSWNGRGSKDSNETSSWCKKLLCYRETELLNHAIRTYPQRSTTGGGEEIAAACCNWCHKLIRPWSRQSLDAQCYQGYQWRLATVWQRHHSQSRQNSKVHGLNHLRSLLKPICSQVTVKSVQ